MQVSATAEKNKKNNLKRFITILSFSLLLGITSGVIGAACFDHYRQRTKANIEIGRFSSLLNEKHIARIADVASRLAGHPVVIATITGNRPPDNPEIIQVLEDARFFVGSTLVYLLNSKGDTVACTPYQNGSKTLTGKNYSFRPYFTEPMRTGTRFCYPALGVTTGRRGIYFSSPVRQDGKNIGVVVLKTDLTFIDRELAKYPHPCALLTKDGIVFASNRQDWLFRTALPMTARKRRLIRVSRQFANEPLLPLHFSLNGRQETLRLGNDEFIPVQIQTTLQGLSFLGLFPRSSPSPALVVKSCLLAIFISFLLIYPVVAFIDRRRLLKRLKAREKDYLSIINNLEAAFYRVDNDGRLIMASPSLIEQYLPENYSPEEVAGLKPETIWLHPEKRQEYLALLKQHGGKIKGYKCQLRKSDGSVAHVLINASWFYDEDGVQRGVEGLIYDVTEMMEMQQRMLLLESAVEATDTSMQVTDVEGNILWVNKAFVQLTGFTMEEVIGRKPSILKSGYQDESFYEKLWQTITSGKSWHGELINRRKDGSTYYEEMVITPVRGKGGEITNFIAIKNDISLRKQREEEIEELLVREKMLNRRLAEKKIRDNENWGDGESSPDLAGKSILLIGNNAFERLLITELLRKEQAIIVSIDNIRQARAELEARQYDIVLLDNALPGIVEILQAIIPGANHSYPKTPVMILTYDENEWRSQGQMDTVHIAGCISKPIEPRRFFAAISNALASFNRKPSRKTLINTPMHKKVTQSQEGPGTETVASGQDTRVRLEDFPILDREAALHRVMGDEDLLEKVLANFRDEFQDSVSDIVDKAENNDWATVKRLVHTLKGAAGGIGGDRLQKACMEMEKRLGHEQDLQTLQPEFDKLAEVLADLMSEIESGEKNSVETSGKTDGSHKIISRLTRQFGSDIRAGKYKQGQQLLKELRRYNWPEDEFSFINRLKESLQTYNFDQASDILSKFTADSNEETA